ncbi:MAG: hypothetical protein V4729_11145 [Pseudomonadota bacterium]
MKDILSLVERVARRQGPSDDADLRDYCQDTQRSLREFSNRLALTLARGFHDGQLSHDFCDEALNYLFNFIMEPQFLEAEEGLPQPAFEIFQAFDTTEYYRGSEPPELDPVERYTRPRIAEILRRQVAD